MKGNMMIRLLSLMILIPAAVAHFTGQIDFTEPTWLWLTLFAGLNAFQSSFTGWCPACKVTDCGSGSCSVPANSNDSACCAPSSDKDSACCSGDEQKESSCCSTEKTSKESDGCSSTAKSEKSTCCDDDVDCLDIKVLGTGCQNCETTATLIEATAKELNVVCCVTKVEDITEISAMGVMATPGVAISGLVVHTGSVPTKVQVAEWLQGTKKDDSPSGCCGSCS